MRWSASLSVRDESRVGLVSKVVVLWMYGIAPAEFHMCVRRSVVTMISIGGHCRDMRDIKYVEVRLVIPK